MSLAKEVGLLRASDLAHIGATRATLGRLVQRGELIAVARGVYALPDRLSSPNLSLAVVSRRVPDAVVTLLSALRFHDLGSENPWQVWIALPTGHWKPKMDGVPLEISWLESDALATDIEHHDIEGVSVAVFSAVRTVVECFRFRSKVGLEPCVEALRGLLRRQPGAASAILECAGRRRVGRVIRPYVEALL